MLKFRSLLLTLFSASIALSIGMKHFDETLELSSKKNIETVEDVVEESQLSHLEIRVFKYQKKVETKRVPSFSMVNNILQQFSVITFKFTTLTAHPTYQFLHLFHLF